MALKELRITFGLTQVEAANSVGVPLRTYIRYESNPDESNLKYQKIVELLKDKYEIEKMCTVDMFAYTTGVESIVLMLRK